MGKIFRSSITAVIIVVLGCMITGYSTGGHRLQYKFTNGEKVKYRVDKVTVSQDAESLPPFDMTITKARDIVTLEVDNITKEGVINLTLTEKRISEEQDGHPVPILRKGILVAPFKILPNGRVLEADVRLRRGQNLTLVLPPLPDKRVKVGDSWKRVIEEKVPEKGFSRVIKFTATLDSFEVVKGVSCAKISFSALADIIPAPPMTSKANFAGTIYFDHREGKILSIDSNSAFIIQGIAEGKKSSSVGTAARKMTRIL